MSVSFSLNVPTAALAAAPHRVLCACDDNVPMLFPTEAGAADFVAHWFATPEADRVPLEGCIDPLCTLMGPLVTPLGVGDHLTVVLSNSNAHHVLSVLGMVPVATAAYTDTCGQTHVTDAVGRTSAQDFLGRVLTGLALNPTDPTQDALPGLYVGRPPGYIEHVLTRLHTLAQEAVTRGWEVTWG